MSATPSSAGGGMSKVLRAIERVRDRVGRVALVGEGWGNPEDWMEHPSTRPSYYVDRDYLKKIGVEALPAVPYREVPDTISKGVFNPVVYRPLFERLGMVTCRTFETPAAGTIPLFLLDRDYVAGDLRGARAGAAPRGGGCAREDPRRAGTAGALRRDRDGDPARISASATRPRRVCASCLASSRNEPLQPSGIRDRWPASRPRSAAPPAPSA